MHCICEQGHYLVIDPFWGEIQKDQLKKLGVLDQILLTHEHYDHISGVNELRTALGGTVLASKVCAQCLTDPTQNFSRYFNAYCQIQQGEKINHPVLVDDYTTNADTSFEGRIRIVWQGHQIELSETPGHSRGSICILIDERFLFSGDTLLPRDLTVTRFPGGSQKEFERKTVPYLKALPKDTLVYPGHGECFRLGTHALFSQHKDGMGLE